MYAAVVTTGVLAAGLPAGAKESTGQWRQLFDGKDLQGWNHIGPGNFVVQNGLLRSQGGMGLLVWDGGAVGDCELRVVYRMTAKNSNSGVFVRVPEKPNDPWAAVNGGFEVQIDNEDDTWHRTGTLYSFTEAKASPGKPGPEWNTMDIRLEGSRTTVRVNGKLVTDFTEGPGWTPRPRVHDYEPKLGARPERGWIGVQNHGDHDVVEFREVAMRPLT